MKWKDASKALPRGEKQYCLCWVIYENGKRLPRMGWLKRPQDSEPYWIVPHSEEEIALRVKWIVKYWIRIDDPLAGSEWVVNEADNNSNQRQEE